MANTVIVGRVAKEVEAVKVGDKTVGKFSVVYDSGKKDADGKDAGTFVNVECRNEKYQDVLKEKLEKGSSVMLIGQLAVEQFEREDGKKDQSLKIVDPDVKFLSKGSTSTAQIFVSGRLTKDVGTRAIGNERGDTVAKLSIAENYGNDKTNFYEVECWNKQGEIMSQYLEKGSLVNVHGELKIERFERENGSKGTSVKIVNPDVKFLSKTAGKEDGAAAGTSADKSSSKQGYSQK